MSLVHEPEKPYIKATENAAAETRTIDEISKQIVLPARGQEHPNCLHLLSKMKPLLRSVWRMSRALQKLSEMFYMKYKIDSFRNTLRDWEALWVKWDKEKDLKSCAWRKYGEVFGTT